MEELKLTDQELDVIRNFVGMLGDVGIQSALLLVVADAYGSGEIPAKALGHSIQDLSEACEVSFGVVEAPQNVAEAAPSLALVVSVATGIYAGPFWFPEDFVPNEELVQKCLDWYFDSVRERAASPPSGD